METTTPSHSGIVTFAAAGAFVIGLWNLMSGIAAVTTDDALKSVGQVMFNINIDHWGWLWIIIGVGQLITAVLIFTRHTLGQVLGIGWAMVSASFAVFLIFVEPIWSLAVVGINFAVIYALSSTFDFIDSGK